MNSRDVFDLVLIVLVGVVLYLDFFASSLDRGLSVGTLFEMATDTDPLYYLIFGGVLGVVFVSYLTIYLPQKQNS